MSKTASARFYQSSKNRVSFQQGVFNSINFIWWLEESSVVKFGFLTVENNDKKRLVIIGSSWWQTLHKQTRNLNFILDLLSKDKFLLSVSKFLSKSLSVFL